MRPDRRQISAGMPVAATIRSGRVVVRLDHADRAHLGVEQFAARPWRQCSKICSQRRATGDLPLDPGEVLEEALLLLHEVEQPVVLPRDPALRFEHVQRAQAQFEHPGHAAEQADFLGVNAPAAGCPASAGSRRPSTSTPGAHAADGGEGDARRSRRRVRGWSGGRRPPHRGRTAAGRPPAVRRRTPPTRRSSARPGRRSVRGRHIRRRRRSAAGPSGRSATTERNSVKLLSRWHGSPVGRSVRQLSGRPAGMKRARFTANEHPICEVYQRRFRCSEDSPERPSD